jgi:phosphodiester glycosidase
VLRPVSRRAGRRNASAYGPESYGPGPYESDRYGSPRYESGSDRRESYGPSAYGPEPPYAPGPGYGPEPPYAPRAPYGAPGALQGPAEPPYRPAEPPYRPAEPPYRPAEPPYRPTEPPYRPTEPPYQNTEALYGPEHYDLDEEPGGDPSWPGQGGQGGQGGRGKGKGRDKGRRRRGRGRVRRLLRLRTVRVILALFAALCVWVAFSVGQVLTGPGGGSVSSKLAEWARDHYLGPVVTFGEWVSYQPPKVGGTPGFSLAAPSGAAAKNYKRTHGFVPNIPLKLTSPAGSPLAGEGVWSVLETVNKEPAIFGTFLRPDKVHTSYVSGIVSLDQRLVSFQLRPGVEDPGAGNWKAATWIPPGTRKGLLATFNGGFKLDSARGGFYLNGASKGSLVNGAASVVYYRNGTIKIGAWGSEVQMTPNVVGVRQNLKLIVDHGKVPATVNQNVLGSWGATLGGGYYVWRSGIGITKGGRIIFVYGSGLIVQTLANLLKRAGAVEAMQLDINPEWMSFDYYKANGNPTDPTPRALLPDQQGSPYRYYSVYSRDFTVVYAR